MCVCVSTQSDVVVERKVELEIVVRGRVRNGEEARVGWRAFQAGTYTSCSLRVGRQGGGEKREQG